MNILLANKYWRPFGGVEAHGLVVEDMLREHGHDVFHLATADDRNFPSPTAQYFVPDVDFRSSGVAQRARAVGRAAFGVASVRALRRLLDDVRIDAAHVLHAYHQLGMQILGELRRRGIPTVLSLHDYKVACPNYRFFSESSNSLCTKCLDHQSGFVWAPTVERCWSGSASAGAFLSLEAVVNSARRTYSRDPGAVIYLNRLQRRSLLARGVPKSKLHHVPHFLDLSEDVVREPGQDVLFVGRLVPEKGLEGLIKACAAAGVRLRVVGDGREAERLQSLASSIPGPGVTFLGGMSPSQVREEMRWAAVLAVPSIWPEVSPLVVMEAIDVGLPIVGSDIGGIPDLIGDGRGVLCPPGDVDAWATAVGSLTADPETGRKYAATARKHAAAEWTRERWWERVQAAYRTAGACI